MIDLDNIKRKLHDRRLDIVAEATGLHRSTIARIRDGEQKNPTYYVMQNLAAYFEVNP